MKGTLATIPQPRSPVAEVLRLTGSAVFVVATASLILNGSGDTKTTFWIVGFANLFNIGANYLLIGRVR